MENTYSHYLKDIRFWIVLFFALRLIGITNPPLEIAHNWRQTTVAMVARNFVEVDANILYPRIDIAGEKTGITGMEFPLLNYLIYLVSMVFGHEHWYGRLINLIVSSLGLWYFFKLIRKFFHEKQAFYATIILLFSIWFSYSRKIMPDTFSTSLIIMAIYFGANYLSEKGKKLEEFIVIRPTGILWRIIEITLWLFLLVLLTIPFFGSASTLKNKSFFVVASILAMVPVIWWYFRWLPYLETTYQFNHFFLGNTISEGFNEIIDHLPLTLHRFYDNALKYVGFITFVGGLTYAIIKKDRLILTIFALSSLTFAVVVFKAGFTFSKHSYYIIPFVPVMALIGGYALSKLNNNKWAYAVLGLIAIEGVGNEFKDFFVSADRLELLTLENELDKVSERDDLILINSGEYPTPIYFAHRKGWVMGNESITADNITELKEKGLKYIVILKTYFGKEIQLDLEKITEKEEYLIYKV